MKTLLLIVAGLAAFGVLVVLIGSRLPVRHRARAELRVDVTPDAIYSRISDVASAPTWRKDVKSTELLAAENGIPRFRETGAHGAITYRVEVTQPPHRFVTRIADTDLGYGGSWTWEIQSERGGSVVTLTEDGEVTSPLFRFMSRYVFGHYGSIETYLRSLAAAFGATAQPRRLPD